MLRRPAIAAVGVFAAALLFSWVIAGATRSTVIFPKYLAAAAAPGAEQAERLLDYSPLYLGFTRLLAPLGYRAILGAQCLLHGLTAAAVALAVALLAGTGWGWVAGLGVAGYRPFLVYAGIHEPESLVLACLALAVLAGVAVRHPDSGAEEKDALVIAGAAAACLALAGLARPQHLALIPIWALWMAAGAGSRQTRRRLVAVALLVPALLVVPFLVSRARATGVPTIMNPGAVFYEGNGPGATGLTRFAPLAVIALERRHPESFDYGHVAYRRIAGFALGRPGAVPPAVSNRYWTGLAFENLRADPWRALGRFGRKAALALAPYEGQDLSIAEQLDRRLRPRLVWGFFLPLLGLPALLLARTERRRQLAGPLAIILLAFAVQVVVYASARQRLPLALGLWITGPVLAADLLRGRLHAAVRPILVVGLGFAVAFGLAALTAREAVLDQIGWDALFGPEPPSLGSRGTAIAEGRAFRPQLATGARHFADAVARAEQPGPRSAVEALRALAPFLGSGTDFTIDDKEVGVPEYWAARAFLAVGDRERAAQAAQVAAAIRPDDPRVATLARRLARPRGAPEPLSGRPPGVDPVSATLARAEAAALDGDSKAASVLVAGITKDFPELAAASQ